MSLANPVNRVYDLSTVKTMAVGFGDLCSLWRTYRRPLAVFLRLHYAVVRPLGAGCGGGTYGYAGFHRRQFANPAICPPTPFGDGARIYQTVYGGYNMANTSISARPEQTHSPFPLAARAARKAARQWFAGIPTQSLAEWRDSCRQDHCHGLPNFDARGAAFDDAFAREIGNLIIGGGRANA